MHNASQLYTDNTTDEYVNQLIKIIGMGDNGIITGNESQYITKTNKDGVIRIVVNKENNEKLYETLKISWIRKYTKDFRHLLLLKKYGKGKR